MNKSYWHYCPIVLVVFLGFAVGGYLSFGVVFLDTLPSLTDHYGRTILALFGLGMLGSATNCASFWGRDINEVIYENDEFLPHFFDFFGYITLLIGGGITGVILYFIFRTGIGISTTGNETTSISNEAAAIIAYIGGLYHFKVREKLGGLMDGMFNEFRVRQEEQNSQDKDNGENPPKVSSPPSTAGENS